MKTTPSRICEFGPFRLDRVARVLYRGDEPIPVATRAVDLLITLIEHRDRVLRKEELLGLVWPDSFVQEANLSQNVFLLRKILGERPNDRRYILTVPGEGYRFVADIHGSEGIAIADPIAPVAPRGIRSLAVLPFQTLHGDRGDDHLGIGLADALITRLSGLRQLIVRPTSAVLLHADSRTREQHADPILVGRTLNVDALVLGTIQNSSGRVRVTVQLVAVSTEASLWAERFDAQQTDLFGIEDSISEQIKQALMLELTDAEHKALTKRHTNSPEAQEAYFKGRYFWNKRTDDGLRRAIDWFNQAIANDPNYALAHAGIADCRNMLSVYSVVSPAEGCRWAAEAATRALAIDDTLAEAHTALAYATFNYDWDLTQSERSFRRAFELTPNYAVAHQFYSELLTASRRFPEALASITRARKLDPTSLAINTDVAVTLFYARRYDEAVEQLRETLELEPGFFYALLVLGWIYEQQGRYAEALNAFERAGTADPLSPEVATSMGRTHAAAGRSDDARQSLSRVMELATRRYVSSFDIATIHAALGDPDQAFDWLGRAYEERGHALMFAAVSPLVDPLRTDPRFAQLLGRLRPSEGDAGGPG